MRTPLIIGHRGAPFGARENTIVSFSKAIEIGADGIEFDVRRTKDRVMVVHHDPAIDGRPLRQLTHQEANDRAGRKGFVIPTVAEVLTLTRGKIKLDVELKEPGYEKEVVGLIQNYFSKEDFVITSFDDQAVAAVKKTCPDVKAGLLLDYEQSFASYPGRDAGLFSAARYRRCGANFLAPHYSLLEPGFLAQAARNRLGIYVWTVDEPGLMTELMKDQRIQAIITNQPDLAIMLYNKLHASFPAGPG